MGSIQLTEHRWRFDRDRAKNNEHRIRPILINHNICGDYVDHPEHY